MKEKIIKIIESYEICDSTEDGYLPIGFIHKESSEEIADDIIKLINK